jgi:hypothetical protein
MGAFTRALAAAVFALAALLVAAVPALADCSRGGPPSRIGAYRGVAFVGTVVRVGKVQVGRRDYDAVTFDVSRGLAGSVSDRVTVRDLGGSCGMIVARSLHRGDRVIFTASSLDRWMGRTLDYTLLFRPTTAGHWELYEDALYWGNWDNGGSDGPYPAEVYGDLTTAAVERLVTGLPATSTLDPRLETDHAPAVLAVALALLVGTGTARRLRTRLSEG